MTELRVLIVDDEPDIRIALGQTLELADISSEAASSVGAATAILDGPDAQLIGAVVCDVKMPERDGFDFLTACVAMDPDRPVMLLTGHGDVEMAVRAMRAGAYDFLEKPIAGQQLVETVRRALEKRRLVLENRALRASLSGGGEAAAALIGQTPVMRRFRKTLLQIAAADVDLLILGETGAGKEVTARAIHGASPRKEGRFVAINCGALPKELAESELFGHEPGAFTGAAKKRIGKFAHADGGTLFLDEIESMPMALQVALLRVLQERVVEPLGSNDPQPIDVRVIAATKVDLRAAADQGDFRDDLFYRLEVARIDIPPLRDRLEDAPLLFAAFLDDACRRRGVAPPLVSPELYGWLMAQSWPGNVRELRNAAERFAIGLPLGPQSEAAGPVAGASLAEQMDAFERRLIGQALEAVGGRVALAAEQLGLPRNTLYDRIKKHGLGRSDVR